MRSFVKKIVPNAVFKVIEPTGHMLEAMLEQTIAGFPMKGVNVIGVTGTDGKTTTSTLITQMLRNSGKKVAMMTTISLDLGDGSGVQANKSRLTTMGSKKLIENLKKVKDANVDWLVLEVTSHALAQNRVWGIPFSVAVMTNINHEHLDYHGTFEHYRDSKKKLFTLAGKNKAGLQTGVLNGEDPSGDLFAAEVKNPVRYGLKSGNLRATNVKLTASGSSYQVKTSDETYKINCNLPGSFNVMNSLAALGVGRALGLSKTQIEEGIASLESVEGRMARIDEGQDFEVIIDYAHTPDSFKKILSEIKPTVKGKLITVFGSAGRRDESKRAEQGKIAGEYSDIVIATEEDDRDIDGQIILEQIASGAEASGKVKGKDLLLVHEREAAVEKAIMLAKKSDVVLLLGKGHEKSILTNKPGVIHTEKDNFDEGTMTISRLYSEEQAARNALKKRKKTDN
jgi:UDP-N-acetylmuramoyl-L-alanyl-D-glutamate--2,6-diaminopimelate ligase